jgi:CRISPR-associated protein Cas4
MLNSSMLLPRFSMKQSQRVIRVVTEIDVNRWIMRTLNNVNAKVFPVDEIMTTEATSPCLRKAYYQRIKATVPTPTEFLKIVGNDVHLKLQDVLKEEGYEIEVGVSVKINDFKLVGRVDALKDDGDDPHIIEFKTIQEIPQEPYESHVLQVQAYLLMTGLEKGYLVYLARKDGRVKVFKVHKDKKALKRLVERAHILYKALKEKVPPPPERGPWCNTCPFTLTCSKR